MCAQRHVNTYIDVIVLVVCENILEILLFYPGE